MPEITPLHQNELPNPSELTSNQYPEGLLRMVEHYSNPLFYGNGEDGIPLGFGRVDLLGMKAGLSGGELSEARKRWAIYVLTGDRGEEIFNYAVEVLGLADSDIWAQDGRVVTVIEQYLHENGEVTDEEEVKKILIDIKDEGRDRGNAYPAGLMATVDHYSNQLFYGNGEDGIPRGFGRVDVVGMRLGMSGGELSEARQRWVSGVMSGERGDEIRGYAQDTLGLEDNQILNPDVMMTVIEQWIYEMGVARDADEIESIVNAVQQETQERKSSIAVTADEMIKMTEEYLRKRERRVLKDEDVLGFPIGEITKHFLMHEPDADMDRFNPAYRVAQYLHDHCPAALPTFLGHISRWVGDRHYNTEIQNERGVNYLLKGGAKREPAIELNFLAAQIMINYRASGEFKPEDLAYVLNPYRRSVAKWAVDAIMRGHSYVLDTEPERVQDHFGHDMRKVISDALTTLWNEETWDQTVGVDIPQSVVDMGTHDLARVPRPYAFDTDDTFKILGEVAQRIAASGMIYGDADTTFEPWNDKSMREIDEYLKEQIRNAQDTFSKQTLEMIQALSSRARDESEYDRDGNVKLDQSKQMAVEALRRSMDAGQDIFIAKASLMGRLDPRGITPNNRALNDPQLLSLTRN